MACASGWFGLLLGRGGHAQQIVRQALGRDGVNAFQHGPAHGERAGFVENNGVEMRRRSSASPPLKRMPSCAPRPTATVSAAGTASPMAQGQATTSTETVLAMARAKECVATSQTGECDCGKSQHDGNEDGAGAVGQPLHGRARALRLLHHAGDLGQDGGFAERLGPAGDGAVVVERAGQYAASRLARLRGGLAGEHGLIDRGAASRMMASTGKALAGQDEHAVAGLNFIQRHNRLARRPTMRRAVTGRRRARELRARPGRAAWRGLRALLPSSRNPRISSTASK
jgi:hypothetical protein